jgi:lysozyme family protein
MASFDLAIPTVLEHEGGLSENPSDPGGATKYGISLRYLQSENLDIDRDGDVDADDIRALTREQAVQLYRSKFWMYEWVKDQSVATKLLDMAVNMGPKQAHKLLQAALGLQEDGVIGPETQHATNGAKPENLLRELRARVAAFYCKLVLHRPRLTVFLLGWMRRAVS